MTSIYKYPLGKELIVKIDMPKDAEILSVDAQYEEGVLWALVNLNQPIETRTFRTRLTGEEFEQVRVFNNYIGTYQLYGGNYVCHVFEVKSTT